jgi:hypothetical protein
MYTRPLPSSSRHSRRSALIASWRAARLPMHRYWYDFPRPLRKDTLS